MHHPVASFLQSICAQNYENLLRADKDIAMKAVCSFFGPLGILTMNVELWLLLLRLSPNGIQILFTTLHVQVIQCTQLLLEVYIVKVETEPEEPAHNFTTATLSRRLVLLYVSVSDTNLSIHDLPMAQSSQDSRPQPNQAT